MAVGILLRPLFRSLSLSLSYALPLLPSLAFFNRVAVPRFLIVSVCLFVSFFFRRPPGAFSPLSPLSSTQLLACPFHNNSPFLPALSRLPRAFQTSPSSPVWKEEVRKEEEEEEGIFSPVTFSLPFIFLFLFFYLLRFSPPPWLLDFFSSRPHSAQPENYSLEGTKLHIYIYISIHSCSPPFPPPPLNNFPPRGRRSSAHRD